MDRWAAQGKIYMYMILFVALKESIMWYTPECVCILKLRVHLMKMPVRMDTHLYKATHLKRTLVLEIDISFTRPSHIAIQLSSSGQEEAYLLEYKKKKKKKKTIYNNCMALYLGGLYRVRVQRTSQIPHDMD